VLNNLENAILLTWAVRTADNNLWRRRQFKRRVRTIDTNLRRRQFRRTVRTADSVQLEKEAVQAESKNC
jgi:hypothetical protein